MFAASEIEYAVRSAGGSAATAGILGGMGGGMGGNMGGGMHSTMHCSHLPLIRASCTSAIS